MTMRKDKCVRTYGRHKNLVIVSDAWLSDGDKKRGSVFSTSSDDSSRQASIFQSSSSSENGALSLNSTGNSGHSLFSTKPFKKQTRSTRKGKKANRENEHTQRHTRNLDSNKTAENQIFSLSSSSESSGKKSATRVLRNRNEKIDYNDSVNLKKQLRGTTAKRKRAVKTCSDLKTFKESCVDFSVFDNYSLLISDSPPVSTLKGTDKISSVETSTPVAKRTRCKAVDEEKLKVNDISYIEMVASPCIEESFAGVVTPESAHSQSLFNTPSILSSQCSHEATNVSKHDANLSKGLNKASLSASVKLNKLGESFIEAALAGNARLQQSDVKTSHIKTRSCRFNNSESLFSSPNGNLENSVSLLTERLKQVRCAQLNNDSVIEEGSDESENSEEDSAEYTDAEEESENSNNADKTQDDSSIIRDGDLSAIDEDEEASEEESYKEYGDNMDGPENESDSSERNSDSEQETNVAKRVTRNRKKTAKSNLERLSESLLMNHVNRRKTTKSYRSKHDDSEMDDLAECLENSHLDSRDSNCTLYMLNKDCSVESRKSKSEDLSVHEEGSEMDSEISEDETKGEAKSAYHTPLSSRHSEGEYCTAKEEEQDDSDDDDDDDDEEGENDVFDSDDDEEEDTDDVDRANCSDENKIEESYVPHTPAGKKYILRGKLQHLQNSFSELLSPKKKKDSLVPLSAQARVFVLCNQTEPISFRTALSKQMISKCKKIGEGVYGEVFRSYNSSGEAVAIKIIPIEGDFDVNDEPQKKFFEILPEVVIAKELSDLRHAKINRTSNFCQVNNTSCVKGKYPAELIKEWDVFHKSKQSENDRPDVFPKKQLYIVFEFADCGTDLESYQFDTIQQAKSVLSQVAYALAVAEETLQFEHRDLHWGNVLVRPTDKENIKYRLMGKPVSIPSQGVEASVIDFTMSRLTKDGCTVYINIPDDDTLFQGEGDYQFDIYREMKKENKGNWEQFCPHTNVLWLHYLADKLVYTTKYPNQSTRQEREVLREFRQFMSTMLQYRSACEMVVDSLFLNS